jgi:ribonucleoside-diphosphate reductase alpha chain
MSDLAAGIWARQYALGDESIEDGFVRVARSVAKNAVDEDAYVRLMTSGEFIPGGRILAGAGSEHGNILNCFVQDGSPEVPGSTDWVLATAKKLALVTKVGGGNGVNLDPIPAKRDYVGPVGSAFVTIQSSHPDANKVRTASFFDLTRGEVVTRPYRSLKFVEYDAVSVDAFDDVICVPDSIVGIWDAAAEMTRSILRGRRSLVDLSELRAEGASVRGSGGSSSGPSSFAVEVFELFARWAALGGGEFAGPVSTLRLVFASTLRSIRQGGTRRGAGMATLSVTHGDLLDFVTAKDLGREAVEGDISTFNVSVLADDTFMRAAQDNPHSDEARKLALIATQAHASGEPGLLFVTTINANNPLAEVDGPIMATNPCVSADSLVLTVDGPRSFGSLAADGGDVQVFAVNRVTRAVSVRTMRRPHCTNAAARVVRVAFESGLSAVCTEGHSFIGLDGSKVEAVGLRAGSVLLGFEGGSTFPLAVVDVSEAGSVAVFNGVVDEDHTYVIVGAGNSGVVSANCGEIPLYPGEPCDLGALNVAAFVVGGSEPSFLEGEFVAAARTAVRFLDDVLDRENAPLPEIRAAIDDKRRIGLGVMGLAHALIRLGLRYDSREGREWVSRVMGLLRDAAYRESFDLGVERGVPAGVTRAGLGVRRNIALLTVAPTGTTSMLAGVSSGVEPVFAASLLRRIGTDYVQVIDPLVEEIVGSHDVAEFVHAGGSLRFVAGDEWDFAALVKAVGEHHGSLEFALGDLPDDPRLRAYRVAHDVSPEDHVLMQATVQRAFDFSGSARSFAGNSISKTINLPNSSSVGDVLMAYLLAWREGAKGITVYRDGSRQFQVLTAGSGDAAGDAPSTAVDENNTGTSTVDDVTHQETPTKPTVNLERVPVTKPSGTATRPTRLRGFTDQVHLTDDLGNRRGFFITVNGDHSGVREVFITSGKAGDEANGDAEALGRVISLALQYGVPTEAIVRTLRGITGGVFGSYAGHIIASKADLVAVALSDATQEFSVGDVTDRVMPERVDGVTLPAPQRASSPAGNSGRVVACPHCSTIMRRSEGCMTCPNADCGFSKC